MDEDIESKKIRTLGARIAFFGGGGGVPPVLAIKLVAGANEGGSDKLSDSGNELPFFPLPLLNSSPSLYKQCCPPRVYFFPLSLLWLAFRTPSVSPLSLICLLFLFLVV